MDIIEIITSIATVVAPIATTVTVIFLYSQIRMQRNKDNTELIFNLYREFYSNPINSQLFSIIDDDDKNFEDEFLLNQVIETIILSEPFKLDIKTEREVIEKRFEIKLPREIDLSNYMNFFNSLGLLIKENKDIYKITNNIFDYQIKKTFAHPTLIGYMYKGKFCGMLEFNRKISIPFFFYGTLKNPTERQENIGDWKWEPNDECRLYGYTSIEISNNEGIYPALIEAKDSYVSGVYTKVEITNFFKFFKKIDTYEEVGNLYERRLDWVNLNDTNKKKLCWIYYKKQ
jgi:hypothetical protein